MGRPRALNETQVKTWLIRDKINRYRGVLKLHAREKKLKLSQATKLKLLVSRKIASLEVDVKRHREIVNDLRNDSKQHVLRLLDNYRRFYLAFNHLKPHEIYTAIYQDCDLKRRFLDKLYYEKKKKLKLGIELQLEHNILSTKLEEQGECLPNCEQQRLVAELQRSIAKYNIAKDIYSTYWSMLNILRKDALFFDTLLNILKEDQSSQCKVMLKVTVMGQLATENLDDIRQKYKQMSRNVLHNMKIREKMLTTVRCEVKDLWAYAQSLVRVESVHIFAKKKDADVIANKTLESQLVYLENICTEVKDAFLVRSHHDLLLRLENQSEQRKILLGRLDVNLKNRDVLWSKKYQAVQVLENLKHSTKTADQSKINGICDMLEQIRIEKNHEKNFKEQIKSHGELLINIRAALQSINAMLLCVKDGKGATKKVGNKKELVINDKENVEEQDVLAEINGMDTDVLALLAKISRKVINLFNISNINLEGKEDDARDLYQIYVSNYNSDLFERMRIFEIGEEEQIGKLLFF
ncbi:uncharacterized protein [Cardiocondyla obscurior]|uniref:uncharacterized protein n=1 Tax=Cardiocondyla obscurior TaxID=286306 RepID=UPI0039656574